MHKTQYNEPMFKVVVSSTQDVITTSLEAPVKDPFETGMEPISMD